MLWKFSIIYGNSILSVHFPRYNKITAIKVRNMITNPCKIDDSEGKEYFFCRKRVC